MPRQQYSRELKMATMREIDSGKTMAEVALGTHPQAKGDAELIGQLERKIGQLTMENDFLKKALRRFRKHPQPIVANSNSGSTSKSAKPRKRRQP